MAGLLVLVGSSLLYGPSSSPDDFDFAITRAINAPVHFKDVMDAPIGAKEHTDSKNEEDFKDTVPPSYPSPRAVLPPSPLESKYRRTFQRLRRKLIRKPSHQNLSDEVQEPVVGLPRGLPIELLLLILSFVNDKNDLANLCRASRVFYNEVQTALYRNINIRLDDVRQPSQALALSHTQHLEFRCLLNQRRQWMLRRSLRTPHLANLVVDFRVSIRFCHGDYRTIHKSGARYSRCNCSKIDTLLGQAVKLLVNLQVLHINCACCRVLSEVYSRHTYLQKLRTTELRELSLQCRCLPYDHEPYRALTAPCMSSIKTLRWDFFWRRSSDPPYRAFLKTHRCLSEISRLLCDDYQLVSPVIKTESLTHVHVAQPWSLLVSIERNPSAFRNICHIGSFRFMMSSPDTIIATVGPLCELPNLLSLEILKYFSSNDESDETHPYYSSENGALVRDLHSQAIASLQKVYVSTQRIEKGARITGEYWIWRLKGLWQGTKTPGFTSWGIINGRY